MDELTDRVARELTDGRPDAALTVALSAWVADRQPVVAEVVRGVGAAALAGFAAPNERTRDKFQAAWVTVAASDASAVATGWLALHLDHLVPVVDDRFGMLRPNWMAEKHAALFERIATLRRRCPDPRIADAAIGLLRDGKLGFWDPASVAQMYRPVVDLLLAAGDPAAAATLREIAAAPRSKRAMVRQWLQEGLPPVADQLEAAAPAPLPDEVAEGWRALIGSRPRGPSAPTDVGALYREVLARPADDAARHVLADALLEIDDPRGQLLSLQLGGADEHDPRVRKLVRAHQRDWIGPDLDDTLGQVVFRRGFLEEASLRTNGSASAEVWEAAVRDERLATLRVLRQGQGNRQHYLRFLMSEQVRDLRQVELPTKAFVDALAAGPARPIEQLKLGVAPKRPVLAKIAASASLGAVTRLVLPDGVDLEALAADLEAVGLGSRLTGLVIDVSRRRPGDGAVLPRLRGLGARLSALREVEILDGSSVATAIRGEGGWALTIRSTNPYGGWLRVPDQGQSAPAWTADRLPVVTVAGEPATFVHDDVLATLRIDGQVPLGAEVVVACGLVAPADD